MLSPFKIILIFRYIFNGLTHWNSFSYEQQYDIILRAWNRDGQRLFVFLARYSGTYLTYTYYEHLAIKSDYKHDEFLPHKLIV